MKEDVHGDMTLRRAAFTRGCPLNQCSQLSAPSLLQSKTLIGALMTIIAHCN
jgi:hypothetical protein